MFGLTILEIMYIVTTIMSGIMLIVYVEEAFNQIDNAFIKLKEERKTLECKVQSLEKELVESSSEEDTGYNTDGKPKSGEINKTLISENRKLHVRCDMLEEELRKMRQQNDEKNEINNKYSFRLFSEKKIM